MQSVLVNKENFAAIDWDENHFKYCEFKTFSVEGGLVCSDFVSCSFRDVEWYWTSFSGSNFIDCQFKDCVFRGTTFPDSRFVECRLAHCRFIKDNLGGDCGFSNTVAYKCSVERCEGFEVEMH
jgi:uncharacterized protein YjbI with pentapeptide repeats